MEDSNIKEGQIHVRINIEYSDNPREAFIHQIASKCMKQGKIYLQLYILLYCSVQQNFCFEQFPKFNMQLQNY